MLAGIPYGFAEGSNSKKELSEGDPSRITGEISEIAYMIFRINT